MARHKVHFTIKPQGLQLASIGVDFQIMTLDGQGKGSITLESGEYWLQWYMIGNPGDNMGIVGEINPDTSNAKKIVEVKKTTIPSGRLKFANERLFDIP